VIDGSMHLTPADMDTARELRQLCSEESVENASIPRVAATDQRVIVVINKSDLAAAEDPASAELWPSARIIRSSSVTLGGTANLEAAIGEVISAGAVQPEDVLVSSARHADALRRASASFVAAAATISSALPLDMASIELRVGLDALGEITGESATDELLDQIFSEFCIGK